MNEVIKTIKDRRSIRKFLDKAVSKEDLLTIVDAGRNAPNSWGMQKFDFTIVTNEKVLCDLADITYKYFPEEEWNRHRFFGAKQIILISGKREDIPVCYADAGCAAENMFIAAQSMGISSVWSNQFSTLKDKKDLVDYLNTIGIDNDHIITAVCIFGYANEVVKEKELISKVRIID